MHPCIGNLVRDLPPLDKECILACTSRIGRQPCLWPDLMADIKARLRILLLSSLRSLSITVCHSALKEACHRSLKGCLCLLSFLRRLTACHRALKVSLPILRILHILRILPLTWLHPLLACHRALKEAYLPTLACPHAPLRVAEVVVLTTELTDTTHTAGVPAAVLDPVRVSKTLVTNVGSCCYLSLLSSIRY